MARRHAVYLAAGTLALTVASGALAGSAGPIYQTIYQGTKSGPGAYVYVGLTKPSSAFLLDVTTKPTGLPINLSWTMAGCGQLLVHTRSPYRRLVRCRTATMITVLAQLSGTPAGVLSISSSRLAGQISLVVGVP